MMKKLLFLLLAFMATVAVNAQLVSRQQALQKAQKFMPGKQFVEGKSVISSRGDVSGRLDAFYVFNADNNGGFVIVSGDDRTTDILGYSKTGNLDMEQLPDNLKWWLESYARQIEALGTSLEPAQKAKARGSDGWDAIEPMIKTQWNQYYPYNMMCPDYHGLDWRDAGFDKNHLIKDNPYYHCVTGCVATAMAQVLYYHEYPENCPALPAYPITSKGWTIKELPATIFEWDKMKETYNGEETDESAEAVAKLMRYCGQAVNMHYNLSNNGGSSAHLFGDVLTEVFGYSKNIRELYRDPYTTSQWEEMIYAELAANRPVLYSGQTAGGGGHQFIIDGYDGNGLFHMNWGWGGMSDDYFVLSLANPNNQGAGGSQTNDAYQFDQSALFGVEPSNAEEVQMPQFVSNISSMKTAVYTRANADVDFTNVRFDGVVYIHYKASTADVNVQFGWALCQNGQIKQVVPSTFEILNAGETYSGSGPYTNTEATLGAGLPSGKYEVCQVYKLDEDAAWSLCSYYWNPSPYTQSMYRTAFLVADVTETTLTVRQTVPSFKVNNITAAEYPSTGSPLDVTLNVTNDGETYEQVVRLWTQKEGEATWTYVAEATRRIDPGMTDDINMSYVPTAAGTYTLKVTNANSNEALKTAKVTVYDSFNAIVGNLKFVCNTGSHQAILAGHTYTSGYNVQLEIPATFVVDGTPYAVTEIADGAFYNCNILSEVTVPEGVKRIGESAFPYCYNLSRVSLPSTLQSIGDNAFYGCPLMSVVAAMQNPVNIARNVFMVTKNVGGEYVETFTTAELYVPIGQKTVYSAADVWKEFPAIYQGELKDITLNGITYTYATGENLAIVKMGDPTILQYQDVVIPSSIPAAGKTYQVKKIADGAFLQIQMNSVTIQPGVEEIGAEAFWNVNGIEEVALPSSVKSIGESAFAYCYYLQTVKLPSTLQSIGENAFYGCPLTSVFAAMENPINIAQNVFMTQEVVGGEYVDVFTSAELYVPIGKKAAYSAADIWKEFLPNINEIEMGSTSLPGDADGNGSVGPEDIKAIVKYIMGGWYEGFNFENANLNGDDKVDASDLVLLINMPKSK